MTTAYPLAWPQSFRRTTSRKTSQFKATLNGAMDNVENSLKRLSNASGQKVTDIVFSTNYSLSERNPKDPGCAVYFNWNGISTCIAVDIYSKLEGNIQAIHHCIEAELTKLRHGGVQLVEAAFRGYAMLPPPSADWRKILKAGANPDIEDVEASYKQLSKKFHPDSQTGSHEKMAELNDAIKQARRELA